MVPENICWISKSILITGYTRRPAIFNHFKFRYLLFSRVNCTSCFFRGEPLEEISERKQNISLQVKMNHIQLRIPIAPQKTHTKNTNNVFNFIQNRTVALLFCSPHTTASNTLILMITYNLRIATLCHIVWMCSQIPH